MSWLYHGTSRESAERIVAEGFTGNDTSGIDQYRGRPIIHEVFFARKESAARPFAGRDGVILRVPEDDPVLQENCWVRDDPVDEVPDTVVAGCIVLPIRPRTVVARKVRNYRRSR